MGAYLRPLAVLTIRLSSVMRANLRPLAIFTVIFAFAMRAIFCRFDRECIVNYRINHRWNQFTNELMNFDILHFNKKCLTQTYVSKRRYLKWHYLVACLRADKCSPEHSVAVNRHESWTRLSGSLHSPAIQARGNGLEVRWSFLNLLIGGRDWSRTLWSRHCVPLS